MAMQEMSYDGITELCLERLGSAQLTALELLEELMNSKAHSISNSCDSTKEVSSWSEICLFTQEFHAVSLLLKWIIRR